MKTKHALIIFIIGFLISLFGGFLKITHWGFGPITGNVSLAIGAVIQVFGIILVLFKLFASPKFKSFLNR